MKAIYQFLVKIQLNLQHNLILETNIVGNAENVITLIFNLLDCLHCFLSLQLEEKKAVQAKS